ncbi:MAG: hypothetical protein QHJ82_07280 [Verrucomicrobiota bacterium]|nr:hypothetical protein [Verrucomicrobiota bacterium]
MNLRLILLCLGLGSAASGVAQLALEAFGEPFDGQNVEIIWQASPDQMPGSLGTFTVLPAAFSSEVVSNVIDLCRFKDEEKVRAIFRDVPAGKPASYQEPYPGKPVLGKSLRIVPANGYINYLDPTASSPPGVPAQAVPSQKQALELAIRLLPKLGIKEADLAREPNSQELAYLLTAKTNGRFDKGQKKAVEEVAARGVILFRQVNGISFSGPSDSAGLRVEFGNNAQIKELVVTWRNLKAEKPETVANRAEIIQAVKQGQAVIRLPERFGNAAALKTLTITQLRPYYFGMSGTEPQKRVFPYVMLVATADTGITNFPVSLNCPILK